MQLNLHEAHFDGVGSLIEVSFTALLHYYFGTLITGRLMEIQLVSVKRSLSPPPSPPPLPFTSLPPPTPLATAAPPSRGSWSALNLKEFLGIKMVSENQQTVNSLSRFWVSEQIKCSNGPRYCKFIRGN